MPNTGIEPAILRSLARRSNQLSYAAAPIGIKPNFPRKKAREHLPLDHLGGKFISSHIKLSPI